MSKQQQQPKPDGIAMRRQRELRDYEKTIEAAQRSFIDLGRALGKIRLESLYIVAGYKTFESYLETRWEISPQHAYRLINAARTALILSPMGYKISSERAARELAPVADDQETLIAVYEEAQRRGDGRVTGALIAEVRSELAPNAEVVDSTFTEEFDEYQQTADEVAAATAAFDAKYTPDARPTPSDGLQPATDHVDQRPGPDSPAGQDNSPVPGRPETERPDRDPDDPTPVELPRIAPDVPSPEAGVSDGDGPEEGELARAPSSGGDIVNTPIGPMSKDFADGLDKHVPDTDPYAQWRIGYLGAIAKVHVPMRYKPEEVAERADDECLDELAKISQHLAEYVERVEACRAAWISDNLPDNVTPIRSAS